jgi:hypothetical protein
LQAIATGILRIGGAEFEFKRITDILRWIVELPRALSELNARELTKAHEKQDDSAEYLWPFRALQHAR